MLVRHVSRKKVIKNDYTGFKELYKVKVGEIKKKFL